MLSNMSRRGRKNRGVEKSSRISIGMVLMYKGFNFWIDWARTDENIPDCLVGEKLEFLPPLRVFSDVLL